MDRITADLCNVQIVTLDYTDIHTVYIPLLIFEIKAEGFKLFASDTSNFGQATLNELSSENA